MGLSASFGGRAPKGSGRRGSTCALRRPGRYRRRMAETTETGPLIVGVVAMVVLLTVLGIVRLAVDRVLEPNDPRRWWIGQTMLYGGTAIFVVILLLLRR